MGKGAVERRKRRQYSLLITKGEVYFGGNHMPIEQLLFEIRILGPTEKIDNMLTI